MLPEFPSPAIRRENCFSWTSQGSDCHTNSSSPLTRPGPELKLTGRFSFPKALDQAQSDVAEQRAEKEQ